MRTKIASIKPLCGYSVEGIRAVYLFDYDEFDGFEFDGTPEDCIVTAILSRGTAVELSAHDTTTEYKSSSASGINTHMLDTFVPELSGAMQSRIHIASKRRYVVLFRSVAGAWLTYGKDAGATLSYANQTTGAAGTMITISGQSEYPLFEVLDSAVPTVKPRSMWAVDFNNLTFCDDE